MSQDRPLVVVFQMVGRSLGGIQRVTASILSQLGDRFRIVVIDPFNNPDFAATMQNGGLEVVSLGRAPKRRYIGGRGSPLRIFHLIRSAPWLLLTMWRFRRWVTRERPDVAYFNQMQTARVFGRLIGRQGVGLVYHLHGARSAEHIGRRTARLFSRRFVRILAVSKIMAQFLVQAGTDPKKVQVVYNAVDAEAIRREAQQKPEPLPKTPPGSVVFVHIGVLMRHKKAQHLGIEALGRLPAALNARLWICGDVGVDGDASYLEELQLLVVELGLQDRVHFLGWRKDVPCVIRASDVCILPSVNHSESFGMVLAEAMAQSKPCIGSTMGGVPEVIEDGVSGLVCEPTTEGLAAAMTQVCESEDLRRSMGEAGRRRVENLFSLNRQVAQVADAFCEAVAFTRARSSCHDSESRPTAGA
ncbi:MAG: glycosyltransferase family 4 protein [Planctomycetota bacterium]